MKQEWSDFSPYDFDLTDLKETLISKIKILDLLDLYSIDYTRVSSGTFSHRSICPLPIHNNGQERTPSFYVSEETNSFRCFGCNNGSNIIDFVRLYKNINYGIALEELCKIAKLNSSKLLLDPIIHIERRKPENTIEYYVIKAGNQLRAFLKSQINTKEYYDLNLWADNIFIKLDKMLDNWPDEQWEKAEKVYNKIAKKIKLLGETK